ncbi:uncharacterized protein PV07_12502 [Cladophialophora immunda]|uniref:Alcohol dehydrogenase-like C-terminal domain-containing protein n=1 Tax=Cladophialophora immunda TaxID=569365 RepID=A0A0D2BUL3_9EURO|nr:uncharacterized protein PV07_12502 [Cladophialophora immunda]KIW22085.1 hypothetical protein PV07_12502 [Cladophialophora immunda]
MIAKHEDIAVPEKNTACVMTGIGKLAIEDRPLPGEPGDHDVIVAPKQTGLCLVFVVDTVISAKRVNVNGQCGTLKFAAADGFDGTLQGFWTIPADFAYKLPTSVSLEEGALIEPLAVAVMAVASVAKMKHNSNVAVFGAGPVGLLTMAVAKALGARRILAVDINESRLAFAKSYVATDVHRFEPKAGGEDNMTYSKRCAQDLRDKFGFAERGEEGIDLVVECSGAETCVQAGIWLVKRRGICVQVGAGPANNLIPMSILVNKEVTLKGSLRYGPGCYALAIDLVRQGRVKLAPLITHRFPFKDAPLAFESVRKGKGEDGKMTIKVLINGPAS